MNCVMNELRDMPPACEWIEEMLEGKCIDLKNKHCSSVADMSRKGPADDVPSLMKVNEKLDEKLTAP